MNAIDLLELSCRLREAERSIDVLCISPMDKPEWVPYMNERIERLSRLVADIAKPYGDSFNQPGHFDPYSIPAISYFQRLFRKMKFLATGTVNYSYAEIRYILCSHQVLMEHLRSDGNTEPAPMHVRYALGICQFIIRRSMTGQITSLMNLQVEQFMQPSQLDCHSVEEIVKQYRKCRWLA